MLRLLIGVLLLTALAVPHASAQKKKLEVTKKWSGSVEDDKLRKDAPDCITSAKKVEAIWKAWKIAGDVPKVDFTKDIVVGVYSAGSRLNLASANLDNKGNLDVIGISTNDFRPGFRFVLGVISKEGVKTVNKKALPTD